MTARMIVLPALPALPAVRGKRERPASYWRRALTLLDVWRRRLRDRRELVLLDDRSLRDIGLTRYDAVREARKPFWRK